MFGVTLGTTRGLVGVPAQIRDVRASAAGRASARRGRADSDPGRARSPRALARAWASTAVSSTRCSRASTRSSASSSRRSPPRCGSRASTRSTRARSTTRSSAARARSSQFVGEIYRGARLPRSTSSRSSPGRENAVGVRQGHGRRPLADLQRPRRRRAAGRSGQLDERLPVLRQDRRRPRLGPRLHRHEVGHPRAGVRGAGARRVRREAAGRPDPRGGRRRGGHGPRVRRHRDGQARLHGRRRGRLRAELAAGAARGRPGEPGPLVVLGHRARQGDARLDAGADVPGRRARRLGRRQRDRQGRRDVPGDPPARGRVGPDQAPPAVPAGPLHASTRASSPAGRRACWCRSSSPSS